MVYACCIGGPLDFKWVDCPEIFIAPGKTISLWPIGEMKRAGITAPDYEPERHPDEIYRLIDVQRVVRHFSLNVVTPEQYFVCDTEAEHYGGHFAYFDTRMTLEVRRWQDRMLAEFMSYYEPVRRQYESMMMSRIAFAP